MLSDVMVVLICLLPPLAFPLWVLIEDWLARREQRKPLARVQPRRVETTYSEAELLEPITEWVRAAEAKAIAQFRDSQGYEAQYAHPPDLAAKSWDIEPGERLWNYYAENEPKEIVRSWDGKVLLFRRLS